MSVYVNPHVLVSQEDTLTKVLGSRKAAKAFLWGARAKLENMHPGEHNAIDITILQGVPYVIPRAMKDWREIVAVTIEAYESAWWSAPTPTITKKQHAAMHFFTHEAVRKAA